MYYKVVQIGLRTVEGGLSKGFKILTKFVVRIVFKNVHLTPRFNCATSVCASKRGMKEKGE
jgi:hypothetical protein